MKTGLFPAFGSRPQIVLANSDWDHTLPRWTNFHAKQKDEVHFSTALQAVNEHVGQNGRFMITTGRSPSLILDNLDLMGVFPLENLAGNNGGLFFRNNRGLGVLDFLKALRAEDTDPSYQAKVSQLCRSGNANGVQSTSQEWSVELFHKTLVDVLTMAGFAEWNPKPVFQNFQDSYGPLTRYFKPPGDSLDNVITFISDQPAFFVGPLKPAGERSLKADVHKTLAMEIAEKLSARLEAMGIQLEHHDQSFETHYGIDYSAKGVNKGLATRHAIDLYEAAGTPVKAVITMDDNYNGRSMLTPPEFFTANGRPVPNFPIIMGEKMPELDAHPQLVRVLKNGELGNAIRRQREKIGGLP